MWWNPGLWIHETCHCVFLNWRKCDDISKNSNATEQTEAWMGENMRFKSSRPHTDAHKVIGKVPACSPAAGLDAASCSRTPRHGLWRTRMVPVTLLLLDCHSTSRAKRPLEDMLSGAISHPLKVIYASIPEKWAQEERLGTWHSTSLCTYLFFSPSQIDMLVIKKSVHSVSSYVLLISSFR